MTAKRIERIARAAATRPALTLGIVLALALGGAGLALRLQPSAGSDTFVSRSSASFQATDQDHRHFGGDPVVVLIRESLPNLVETKDLATVTQLEACLAGQVVVANETLASFVPSGPGATPYGGWHSPCGKLMKARPAQVVYGPGTFLNRAVAAVNQQIQAMLAGARQAVSQAEQAAYQLALGRGQNRQQALAAAQAAGLLEQQQQTTQLAQDYLNSGISGTPRIDDPQFIPQIVFDQTRGVNQPKARFAYLFPTADSALIQVRLKASLSDSQQASAISWIRQAVKMPMFHSAFGGTYTVTGAPVVTNDLASQITGSIGGLLIAALLVMAATLLIVFRSRLRLLPLAIAVVAAGITFGLTSLLGGSLTLASLAVLPILIGLAVDYAVQYQSRAQEEQTALEMRTRSGQESLESAGPQESSPEPASTIGAEEAVARAAAAGAPTIAIAALATATGFLVLLLSPVPMVRGFGILLVVGIAVALACALTAGSAAMVLRLRRPRQLAPRLERGIPELPGGGELAASLRGACEILRDVGAAAFAAIARFARAIRRTGGRIARRAGEIVPLPRPRFPIARRALGAETGIPRQPPAIARALFTRAVRHPGRVIAVGFALALIGWVADTQTPVQSDVTKLVPSNMPALRDLHTLEQVTGVSGEIDVTVRASDVATPATIGWMLQYEQALLAHFGYLETEGCAHATLCPALSLPDLFSAGTGGQPGSGLTTASIRSLLAAVPSYFSQAVITPDRRQATLAFGIRLMPLSRQQRVIDYMASQLHPPHGVSAQLAGLPVLAAQANAALSSSARRLLTLLVGLIAVGLVLMIVFRRAERALVPLIPIALATGWSSLILFVIGIPLNPMSATLGALVIAISTEFSVLLSERFRQERRAGQDLREALARTYRFTGTAVLTSGITAIAGFGVLILSSINMLRDFGFVTLIDLTVSLVGVLLVLPAALVLSERGEVLDSAREQARRIAAGMPWARRRTRVA